MQVISETLAKSIKVKPLAATANSLGGWIMTCDCGCELTSSSKVLIAEYMGEHYRWHTSALKTKKAKG